MMTWRLLTPRKTCRARLSVRDREVSVGVCEGSRHRWRNFFFVTLGGTVTGMCVSGPEHDQGVFNVTMHTLPSLE